MRTEARLDRLALVFASTGCETCRGWSAVPLCDDQGESARPEDCPTCGRVVPIRVTVCIVGVPLETV